MCWHARVDGSAPNGTLFVCMWTRRQKRHKSRATETLTIWRASSGILLTKAHSLLTCARTLLQDLPELSDDAGVLPFSEVLVGKCKSEFELMGKEPERDNVGDLSAEDRDHMLKKLRQRTLGNVEFIGALFKTQMVDLEVLEGLLNKLLDTSPEDHDVIHPLVKLLESTGKPLETASKEKMDGYFARIQELAAQPGLSSRYKFMLLDLKDLRAKDWVPRYVQALHLTHTHTHIRTYADLWEC